MVAFLRSVVALVAAVVAGVALVGLFSDDAPAPQR